MLRGRFGDTSGRPYIEGRLAIPRLGISANISFVIDTGADSTLLMPLDAVRINLDYQSLTNEADSVGIGGISKEFVEPALVAFSDHVAVFAYEVDLRIATPSPDIMSIPSILGRDILNRWSITYSWPNRIIEIYNDNADHIYPVNR